MTVNCNVFDGTNLDLDTTFIGSTTSGNVSVTATGNITFLFISTSGFAGQNAGDISLSGGDIFLLDSVTANGGTPLAAGPGKSAGAISLTATDTTTPLITVNADIIAVATTGTTTGLGGQVTFNSPVSFTRLAALNTTNTIRTFGTNTGNSGNITFGSTATIGGSGNQGLILDAAGGGTNPALIGDISLGANILNGAIASLSILGGLIGVKDFGTATQAGVLGTISMTSYLNDGASPTNNINFNGNTYNSSSTQVYTGVSGKAFSMQASTLATTFSNAGANITFNNSVIELVQSGLIINTNGGNIRVLNITSSTTGLPQDVTLNAGNGTVFVGQIGGVSGSYGNLNGVNTVLITGLSGVTLNSNILTSNTTNNSVTINGPVVINANITINTSQNILDTTGSIFLSSTLNALGGVTLNLDASNSTQSANVTIAGLIGAGASGSLGGLDIQGNQIVINGIGSATQFGVIGTSLLTAANAGSVVGAISFTGTTYRTNGTQGYNAGIGNALTLNGGISGSLTSFITLDDAVTFTGSTNLNLRSLAVDTTNAVNPPMAIGANILFTGTVSGSAGLSLTAGNAGNVNLTQNVGSGLALTGVIINSSASISSQAINVAGSGSITLTSDAFTLSGAVSSISGTITLQQNTKSKVLAINNTASGTDIPITTAEIANFSTSGMVIYGNAEGTGDINLAGSAPTSFPYNVTFRIGSTSTTAKINVNGNVSTPAKSITYAGNVVAGASNLSDTTNNAANPTGANIIFSGSIKGTTADTQIVTLNAGTAGTITVNGTVGETTSLNSLKILNSNGATFQGFITAGTDVEIVNTVIGRDIRFNGLLQAASLKVSSDGSVTSRGYNLYLLGGASITNLVTFNNAGILQLGDAATDNITFTGGMVATSPSVINLGAAITTLGVNTLTFGDVDTPVTLVSSSSVGSGSGAITFGGAVTDGASSFQLSLQPGTGTGNVTVTGNLTIDSIIANALNFNVNINGLNNVLTGSSVFNNTGTVAFGGTSASASTTFSTGLSVNAAAVEVAGALNTLQGDMNLGSNTKPITLKNNAQVGSGNGALNFNGIVTDGGVQNYILTLQTPNAIGSVLFAKNITVGSLVTSTGSYSITFSPATTNTIKNASSFSNTGVVTFNGTTTFDAGVTATSPTINLSGSLLTTGDSMILGNVTLTQQTGNSTLSSAGTGLVGGGLIQIGTLVEGANSNRQALVLMDNTANSNGGQVNFMGNVNIAGITTFAKSYGIAFQGTSNIISGLASTTFNNTGTTIIGNDISDQTTFVSGVKALNLLNIAGKVLTTGTKAEFGAINLTNTSEIDTGNAAAGQISTGDLTLNGYAMTLDSGTVVGSTISVNSIINLAGSVTVRDAGGLVTFGTLGSNTTRGNVTITNSQAGVLFNAPVTAAQINLNGTANNQTITFANNLDLTSGLKTAAGYNLALNGTTNVISGPSSTTFSNSGTLAIGTGASTNTFTNGFSVTTASSLALNGTINSGAQVTITKTTTLAGNTTLALTGATASTISGALSGASSLTLGGTGTLNLTGNSSLSYTGSLNVAGGNLSVNADYSGSNVSVTTGSLSGIGATNVLNSIGGTVAPGNSPGILTATASVFNNGSTFSVELASTSAGGFDQLNTGSVVLNAAALFISAAQTLQPGQVFTIVNNTGAGSVSGTFGNLPEGASVTGNGVTFKISYVGGTGNDVTLTVSSVTPTPTPTPSPTPAPTPTPPAPSPTPTPTPTGPYVLFATGAGPGGGPEVKVNFTNGTSVSFFAYDMAYTGGVRVTMGDLNGDGNNEIITGTGPGGGPNVRVFTVTSSGSVTIVANFFAFEPQFTGGIYVAAGNLNGDVSGSGTGIADLIVSAGPGGGPRVIAYGGGANYVNLNNQLCDYFVYSPSFTGGVSVAAGNVVGAANSTDEIITGAGPGGGPHVRAFQLSNTNTPNSVLEYMAFNPALRNGIFVGAGDLDADGYDEIFTGTNSSPSLPTMVNVRYGNGNQAVVYPFGEFTGGATVGVAKDSNNNQYMVVGAGPSGGPLVQIYNSNLIAIDSLFAFPINFTGGVFVSTSIS